MESWVKFESLVIGRRPTAHYLRLLSEVNLFTGKFAGCFTGRSANHDNNQHMWEIARLVGPSPVTVTACFTWLVMLLGDVGCHGNSSGIGGLLGQHGCSWVVLSIEIRLTDSTNSSLTLSFHFSAAIKSLLEFVFRFCWWIYFFISFILIFFKMTCMGRSQKWQRE